MWGERERERERARQESGPNRVQSSLPDSLGQRDGRSLHHRASSEWLAAPSLRVGLEKVAGGAPSVALLQGQRKFAIPGGRPRVSREPAGGCVSDGSRHDGQEGGATAHWLLGLNLFSPLNFRRRSCGEEEEPRQVRPAGGHSAEGKAKGREHTLHPLRHLALPASKRPCCAGPRQPHPSHSHGTQEPGREQKGHRG